MRKTLQGIADERAEREEVEGARARYVYIHPNFFVLMYTHYVRELILKECADNVC